MLQFLENLVIAKPMVDITKKSTVNIILINIILTYGIPSQANIISDSVPDMVSTTVHDLYDSFGITNICYASYKFKSLDV